MINGSKPWDLLCSKKLSGGAITQEELEHVTAALGLSPNAIFIRANETPNGAGLRRLFETWLLPNSEALGKDENSYELASRAAFLGCVGLALAYDAREVARDVCIALVKRDFRIAYQATVVLNLLIVLKRADRICEVFCSQAIRYLHWHSEMSSETLDADIFRFFTTVSDSLTNRAQC